MNGDQRAALPALRDYSAKRTFGVTPEPVPTAPVGRTGPLLFVIQHHAARQLHYDFRIEEEILFPALHEVLKDKRLVPRALVEHDTLKDLVAKTEAVTPDGEHLDAKVKVLSEYVKHHVRHKQNELLPRVTATILDMMELGAKIAARKEELVVERTRRAKAA